VYNLKPGQSVQTTAEMRNTTKPDKRSCETPHLEVIGAGLSRTGTMSLKTALDLLVGPCYHGTVPTIERHADCQYWNSCLQAGEVVEDGYQEVLGGYRAAVDFPAVMWYKELLNKNPDAKVILTIRNPLKWRESCLNSVGKYLEITERWPCTWFHKLLGLDLPREAIIKMPGLNMWEALRGGEESSAEYFNRHVDEVKKHVPKEKLLIFQVQEGWDPLCKFLCVPVPNKPFPRTNDTKHIMLFTNICLVMSWFTFFIFPILMAFAGLYALDTSSFLYLLVTAVLVILFVKLYVISVLKTIWTYC